MGRSRYKIFENEVPYFITCTVVNWLPLFSSPKITAILLDSLKFLQNKNRLIIYAYTVMITHIHFIGASKELNKEIGIFKSYTARQIIDYLTERNSEKILKYLSYYKLKHKKDRDYQVWQEGNKPKQIVHADMMRQKIQYIHFNPVKSGYVDDPVHWRYSSARNYAGLDSVINIELFSM
jgi:REP element-mobilizing transposase RayT